MRRTDLYFHCCTQFEVNLQRLSQISSNNEQKTYMYVDTSYSYQFGHKFIPKELNWASARGRHISILLFTLPTFVWDFPT